MAAMAAVRGDPRALTPPSSSHSDERPWGHSRQQNQAMQDKNGSVPHNPSSHRLSLHQNSAIPPSALYNIGGDNGTRKMSSIDNLYGSKWDKAVDSRLSSSFGTESSKMGRSDWSSSNNHSSSSEDSRPSAPQRLDKTLSDDKWIHRDKLAKIENDELQAAGFYIPRPRAQSKQRRERSSTRRDADTSDDGQSQTAPKSDFVLGEPQDLGEFWDPRTPEEIAEEEANQYFAPNGSKGSRIPVAKVSPAPISQDYLERETPASRKPSDSPEGETATITYSKNRLRSASTTVREATSTASARIGQRSVTDVSPKKAAAKKKVTGTKKSGTENTGRPRTRSGPNNESQGRGPLTRPRTRSGDALSNHRAPEGDPPWMFAGFKPDPRLPPEQQIIPTVARRLAQEQWEKEGKFGDIYDKDFRPLNDNSLINLAALNDIVSDNVNQEQSQEENQEEEKQEETVEQNQDQDQDQTREEPRDEPQDQTTDEMQDPSRAQSSEWPFKPELSKSSTVRQGSSYSTMPKISDRPRGGSVSSPRASMSAHAVTEPKPKTRAQQREKVQRVPSLSDEQEKKAGCACCVVM